MCQKESWEAVFATTEAHSTQRDQPPRMHGPGLKVLLSPNLFGVCFGPSTGREIILFRRLWESWTTLNYHLVQQEQPILIPTSERVKTCILQHCQKVHPRDDHREFVNLAALMVGFKINVMHRARRIARFIYSMKIELLF